VSLMTLEELARLVPDGARLAIPKEDTGVSMAATLALVRRRVRGLHLVCVPVSGLQADVLIGAGCVVILETSAITLGEFGLAPRFTEAVRQGRLRLVDGTCPAIYAGLQASQKGIPFMPLRGIIGSDLLAHRDDWKTIANPFAEDDPIVAIRAIRPDVALFHAQAADRFGNVFIGRDRDGLLLAHASDTALVTVERIVEGNLLEDPARAGSTVPAMYVGGIALAPQGTWPVGFEGGPPDGAWMRRYVGAARDPEGFRDMLASLEAEAPWASRLSREGQPA
jgi:glutaconate CoA-transferase subunit A